MNSPDRDPLIGLAIGRYVIREKLAEGGMGAVYVAVHETLPDTKKVVKVLLGEYMNHPVIRARFEREGTAAARLKHRHIIKIDDFGSLADGQLFLMMPFLDGKSLETHLKQHGRLNIYDATHIIEQVLVALQYLHEHGIVHRDLKPGNIFITRADDNPLAVTIIDLGIARDVAVEATTLKTDTGISMGTPGYMAPEQYGDAGNATPAADLYAVGIMLWEMLVGQRPWNAPNSNMMFHLQVSSVPELPPGVELPPELLALLHKMLAKNPNDRPWDARQAGIDLASLVPAIPPHVPSGAEILKRVAPEFGKDALPLDGTLRNRGNDLALPAAVSWTPQATNIPALPNSTPPRHFPASRPEPTPAPTVNQHGFAQPVYASPTPAMPGPAFVPPAPTNARVSAGKIIAIGVVCAALMGVTTFLIASSRHHRNAASAVVPGDAGSSANGATPVTTAIDARAATVRVEDASVGARVDATSPAPELDAGVIHHVDAGVSPTHPHTTPTGHAPTTSHRGSDTVPAAGSASQHVSPKKFDPDAVED